jgi:hypothetical protein
MNPLIPLGVIGGPFIGLLILSVSLKGPSSMGGSGARMPPSGRGRPSDASVPLLDPMHAQAPRRLVRKPTERAVLFTPFGELHG